MGLVAILVQKILEKSIYVHDAFQVFVKKFG